MTKKDLAASAWSKPFAQRPGGRYILDHAVEGDHVVFWSIDRMARNLMDFCNTTHYFQRRGIHVHYITNQINTATSTGKLQANIMAAMAQYSSDLTSERTREALLVKKLRENPGARVKPVKTQWAESPFGLLLPEASIRMHREIKCYERVSSEGQYISGLGLENQTVANASYARQLAAQGGTIGETYSDPAISAYSIPFSQRPAGKRLLESLRPGDDVVIYRLDRGWRNTLDALETIEAIHQKGAFVHFVCERIRTDSGKGKEWIGLLSSIAQLESQIKSHRIKAAMAACRAKGRPTSDPRYGFKAEAISPKEKRLAVDKKQGLEAAKIWVMKYDYKLTHTQIEDMMLALKAQDLKKKAVSSMMGRFFVKRKLDQIQTFIKLIGESQWSKFLVQAREHLSVPMDDQYLRLIKWKCPFSHSAADETRRLASAS